MHIELGMIQMLISIRRGIIEHDFHAVRFKRLYTSFIYRLLQSYMRRTAIYRLSESIQTLKCLKTAIDIFN